MKPDHPHQDVRACRFHLELACWQFCKVPNDSEIVGRRCLLAAFHSKVWNNWDDLEKRHPATEIAKAVGSTKTRISQLLNGKAHLPDKVMQHLGNVCRINWGWLMTGRWIYRPDWFKPYDDSVMAFYSLENQKSTLQRDEASSDMAEALTANGHPGSSDVYSRIKKILTDKHGKLKDIRYEKIAVGLSRGDWLRISCALNPEIPGTEIPIAVRRRIDGEIDRQLNAAAQRPPVKINLRRGRTDPG